MLFFVTKQQITGLNSARELILTGTENEHIKVCLIVDTEATESVIFLSVRHVCKSGNIK